MRLFFSILLGKLVRAFSRLKGGGTALPGLVVERINPGFLAQILGKLPQGIVVVSGTNGKTTTTKIAVELLESQGLRVFTNKSGSNFTRGVVSAILQQVSLDGNLQADIAVLELDEAHAVHFVNTVAPSHCLLLNVLRDQLDRFGEIDHTASLLQKIALRTTKGVVLNRDDPRLGKKAFRSNLTAPIATYGTSGELQQLFVSDDHLRDTTRMKVGDFCADDTCLEQLADGNATISFDGTTHDVSLEIKGIHNVLNATAAIALVRQIMGNSCDTGALFKALAHVQPSFGRGETIEVDGQPIELVLVKNPSGFRLGLASYTHEQTATMIAINDNYADGRDMSWLWDVDFTSLGSEVAMVSGVRSYDMALRLQYDDIRAAHVEPSLETALDTFISEHTGAKRIFCTYTAMLALRKALTQYTNVEKAL